jgi:transposase
MNRKNKLFFEVLESTFNTDRLIRFMDNFAALTIKRTVVILDNSPIYRSKKFGAKIQEWRDQDVYIFFLSPYSPELNLIEILWRRFVYQWLSFDAYLSLQNHKERLIDVLENVGIKHNIIF